MLGRALLQEVCLSRSPLPFLGNEWRDGGNCRFAEDEPKEHPRASVEEDGFNGAPCLRLLLLLPLTRGENWHMMGCCEKEAVGSGEADLEAIEEVLLEADGDARTSSGGDGCGLC